MFDLSKVESDQSYSPLNPGEQVGVVLEKIEVTEDGHLDFTFRGTSSSNAGTFKPRFWANNFDPTDERYNADNAENLLKQVRQIIEAYVPKEKADQVKGENWVQFANSIKTVLTPDTYKDIPALMKVVLKYNSDDKTALPKYGAFISTDLKPKGLKLKESKDANGIPYERVLPLSEYNVSASNDAPSLGFEDSEEVPAFGAG